MRNLFTLDQQFERLDMPDAEVSVLHGLPLPLPPEALFNALYEQTVWHERPIIMYGKPMMQPRLMAWYGDPRADYSYSGLKMERQDWSPLLSDIKTRLEDACEVRFNSVLLNLYRNERDSMAMHADNERELGGEPVIASLTLGATRMFVMKHRKRRDVPSWHIPLVAGDVLLMRGYTQTFWNHGVPKQTQPCGARINLTFRTIVS